jgi:hypothetical protein
VNSKSENEPTEACWNIEEVGLPGGRPGTIAIAISVSHSVLEDVVEYLLRANIGVGRVLHALPPSGPGRASIRDGAHAWALVEALVKRIREERNRRDDDSSLHLFIAAPNALSFFLGRQSFPMGNCTVYEYDFDTSKLGGYSPSIRLDVAPGTKLGLQEERHGVE